MDHINLDALAVKRKKKKKTLTGQFTALDMCLHIFLGKYLS